MENQELIDRTQKDSTVLVAGKDMFGAPFTEQTQLVELTAQRIVFALYRPLVEDLALRVQLRHDREEASLRINGIVSKVRNRLDGMQTVELRIVEVSVCKAGSSQTEEAQGSLRPSNPSCDPANFTFHPAR